MQGETYLVEPVFCLYFRHSCADFIIIIIITLLFKKYNFKIIEIPFKFSVPSAVSLGASN